MAKSPTLLMMTRVFLHLDPRVFARIMPRTLETSIIS